MSLNKAASALEDPVAALRHILPPEVHAGGGPIGLLQRPLPASERAALVRARGGRISEFTAGRSAARDALADCGVTQAVLPQSKGGPPVWPAGHTGSITHARGWALAVCGPTHVVGGLGLDIELRNPDLDLSTIANRTEIAQTTDHLAGRIFSAKEAAYKAQYPLTGRMCDFPDIEICFAPARRSYSRETGSLLVTPFTARLLPAANPLPALYDMQGLQVDALDMVISLVTLPADAANAARPPAPLAKPRATLLSFAGDGFGLRLQKLVAAITGFGPRR